MCFRRISRLFFSVFAITIFLPAARAQYTPRDRCVCDSLTRIVPRMSGKELAKTYLKIATLSWDSVPGKALGNILSALRIAIQQNDPELKAEARVVLGSYYAEHREFMQAQEHYLAALRIYTWCKDAGGTMNVYCLLGALSRSLEDYNKSFDFFKKGRDLALKEGNLEMTGKFLENMGILRQLAHRYPEANRFYCEAQETYRKAGNTRYGNFLNNSIGTIYLDREQYDSALTFYLDLLRHTDTLEYGFTGSLYTRLGHIYFQKKDYRTSLAYNQKALQIRQKGNLSLETNSSLINIGGDFYMLGKPDSGRIYFDRGLKLALKYERMNLVQNVYRHLYRYYLARGDYQQALDHYRRYASVDSAIKQERYRSNISILEANQQVLRVREYGKMLVKRYKIQMLNQENQKYQFTFVKILTGLAAVLMIALVLQYLYIRRVRWDMQELNHLLRDETLEREKTESQAREREQQFRFLAENSMDFITHLDQDRRPVYASRAAVRIYGYEPAEILSMDPADLICRDQAGYWESKYAELIRMKTARQFIYQAKHKNGECFWVESVLNPLFDATSGAFKGTVGVTRDIQGRKNKEFEIMEGTKQKENLLKEIHHRVKNNFAILVSLINMQMAQTRNQELLQSLTNLQLRIRTMALVHEMLYRSKDFENISFSDYLRSLASVIAGTYNRRDIELHFESDNTVLDIEASIPVGLIVNEILSNSYKHAFPGGRSGNIWVTFRVEPGTGRYCLVLQDDGIGLPPGRELESFTTMGLQVVQILCQQIEAELEMISDQGLGFTITFKPAPRVL